MKRQGESGRFILQSRMTDLKLCINQLIKVRGVMYKVCEEERYAGIQMGCFKCAFNLARPREEFNIPPCRCLLKMDFYPVTVYLKNDRELCFTCHDLYLACTGEQSLIYKLNQ